MLARRLLYTPRVQSSHTTLVLLLMLVGSSFASSVRAQQAVDAPGPPANEADRASPTESGADERSPVIVSVSVDVVVVRDGDVAGVSAVDDELARALREVGGFSRVVFSSVPLADLRLAVGCGDEGASCLDRLARALEATAIVVRRVRANPGGTTLSLVYRDRASNDAPLTATRTGTPGRLADEMQPTVRSLYGVEDVANVGSRRVRGWTWVTIGSGAGVLLGGAILGASASWGEHTTLQVNSAADVDRIEASFAAAETRALAGNIMIGIGAVTLGVGGALMLIDLLGAPDEPGADHLDLAFAPSLQGGMLTLRHASRNFL